MGLHQKTLLKPLLIKNQLTTTEKQHSFCYRNIGIGMATCLRRLSKSIFNNLPLLLNQ